MPTMKSKVVIVVSFIFVVGTLAWALYGYSPSKSSTAPNGQDRTQVSGNEESVSQEVGKRRRDQSSAGYAGVADLAPADVVVAIENGATVREAIEAQSVNGVLQSEAAAELARQAAYACSGPMDPYRHADSDISVDVSRAWAIARLIELCVDFDAQQFSYDKRRPSPQVVAKTAGKEAALAAAAQNLSESASMVELVDSVQFLVENNALPSEAISPEFRELGLQDVLDTSTRAASLIACDEFGGCGPQSLEVAVMCAHVGCNEGLGYREALRVGLPDRDYQRTMALYRWMKSQRR